jgi:DNA-directed RNA polymerase subunit RPC12/RpoP
MQVNLKRYALYLVRWQLSTPILAPVVAWFKDSPSIFGTAEDWIGSAVANLIGGLIFFWVDRFIFTSRSLDSRWEVKEEIACADCGRLTRGYRLVTAPGYDRSHDKAPEFRCEECSREKSKRLREKGIGI